MRASYFKIPEKELCSFHSPHSPSLQTWPHYPLSFTILYRHRYPTESFPRQRFKQVLLLDSHHRMLDSHSWDQMRFTSPLIPSFHAFTEIPLLRTTENPIRLHETLHPPGCNQLSDNFSRMGSFIVLLYREVEADVSLRRRPILRSIYMLNFTPRLRSLSKLDKKSRYSVLTQIDWFLPPMFSAFKRRTCTRLRVDEKA